MTPDQARSLMFDPVDGDDFISLAQRRATPWPAPRVIYYTTYPPAALTEVPQRATGQMQDFAADTGRTIPPMTIRPYQQALIDQLRTSYPVTVEVRPSAAHMQQWGRALRPPGWRHLPPITRTASARKRARALKWRAA